MVNALQQSAHDLLKTDRYNKAALPQLTECVQSQVADGWYDVEINLAILKLYQFHPSEAEGLVDMDVLLKILVKALMQMPNPDFKLCLYLVPAQYQDYDSITSLTELAQKLETCQFVPFWQHLEKKSEILAVVPGLDTALRKTIFDTVALTYQEIPSKVLSEFLNIPVHRVPEEFPQVTLDGDRFILPLSPNNQAKPKMATTRGVELQLPQLAPVLSNSLY
uniref:Eukaryotic translation initiation factor 3 subunit K n=1 Tax=Mucochytrium quahogii TaxID=96639 RepID=A0A7S2RE94_9STRA|mmetsp:Transcript_5291/g.8151  ORF Transcript_5291/g.8151 Transcript_5291/m.8151 type:complete len:221 (+) Transcript_5291:41-703(+)